MYRILVVDDEADILEWLQNLLIETFGEELDVQCMESSNQALQYLNTHRVDIAIYDISLPNINGISLAEQTLAKWHQTPIIFLTGYDNFDYARQAVKLGAVDYVLKNEDDEALITAVKAAIQKKYEMLKIDELHQMLESLQLNVIERELSERFLQALGNNDMDLAEDIVNEVIDGDLKNPSSRPRSENVMVLCLDCLSFAISVGLYQEFLARADLLAILQSPAGDIKRIENILKKSIRMLAILIGGEGTSNSQSIIDTVHKYIQGNIGNNLSLIAIADAIHMNPSYFSWYYKNKTGQNISDYIRDVRAIHAMQLLQDQNLTIQEVARQVGYHNPAYFTRFFKQKTGMTPQAYKDKYLSQG